MTDILNRMETHLEKSVKLAEEASCQRIKAFQPSPPKQEKQEKNETESIKKGRSREVSAKKTQKEFNIFDNENPSKQKMEIKRLNLTKTRPNKP